MGGRNYGHHYLTSNHAGLQLRGLSKQSRRLDVDNAADKSCCHSLLDLLFTGGV